MFQFIYDAAKSVFNWTINEGRTALPTWFNWVLTYMPVDAKPSLAPYLNYLYALNEYVIISEGFAAWVGLNTWDWLVWSASKLLRVVTWGRFGK
jgi:hypothetical protein